MRLVAEQIDLHAAESFEGERQAGVQPKTAGSVGQRLKATVQKGLNSAPGAIYPLASTFRSKNTVASSEQGPKQRDFGVR